MREQSNSLREVKFVVFCTLAAAMLRLDLLIASNFVIDADEGIVGLMAKHINDGLPIPIFYYGQHYMGSFEPVLVSIAFDWFGISSAVLKLVPLFFSLLFVVLMYFMGSAIGGPISGRIAALCSAVAPCFFVVWGTKARGGFIEVICLAAIALLSTIHWLKQPGLSRTFFIGFVLGFGWWVNNQIIFCIPPIGLFMLLRLLSRDFDSPRSTRILGHALIGLAAFFFGGLLFWLYNFENEFASFGLFAHSTLSEMAAHAAGLFARSFPIIFGAQREWSDGPVFPGAALSIYVLYGFLFVSLVVARASHVRRLLSGTVSADYGPELLLVFVGTALTIFCISSFGYLVQAPRYLLPLYAGIFPLLGLVLSELWRVNRFIAMSALMALIGINLLSLYLGGRAIPGEPHVYEGERVSRDHSELISFLQSKNIHWVRTNYWIGYRLAFETSEQVRFILFQEPHQTRIQSYREASKDQNEALMPLVLVPRQALLVKEALAALGIRFSQAALSGYVVLYDLVAAAGDLIPLGREDWTLGASRMPEEAHFAVDGNLETRWRSAQPQNTGMWFRIQFPEARSIRSLRYDLGDFTHDWPRKLRVVAETQDGSITLLSESHWRALSYYLEGAETIQIHFDPVSLSSLVLYQEGSDAVFDWSIAEINLFQ